MQPGRRRMTSLATRRSRHYRLHVTAGGVVRAEYMPVLLNDAHIPAPARSGREATAVHADHADGESGAGGAWQQLCGPNDLHCVSCE